METKEQTTEAQEVRDQRCVGPAVLRQRKEWRRSYVEKYLDECRTKKLPVDVQDLYQRMLYNGLFSRKTSKCDAVLSIEKYIRALTYEGRAIQGDA